MIANRNLMRGIGLIFWTGVILPFAVSAAPSDTHKSSPRDVDAASLRLLAAAEPFEALTEMAFSAQASQLDADIASADTAARSARSALPPVSMAQLDSRLAEVHAARKSNDRAGLAISSVEAYRTLVSAARPSKVPTAVNLLDYAGFRYGADLQAKPIRWPDMKEAAAFAREQWGPISHQIADPSLKTSVDAVTDMEAAATHQNSAEARRAAKAELDLVDRLEGYFNKG